MIFSKDHIDYIGECHLFSLKRYFFQTKRSALHTKKKSRVFTLSTSDHFVWSAHCHFGVDRLFCSFFLFIFILRRNVMLNRVASCISKVRRWQFFVWKPYFRWSCTLLDAKRQLQTVIKNPFFLPNAHTHAGRFWNIHAKPTECHIIRCCFSSFIYFAAILHRNERENEAEIK